MYTPELTQKPASVSRQARDQIHEMMAAVSLLAPSLEGQNSALHYLASIRRGLYRQLYLIRRLELEQQLSSPDEIRLRRAPVDLAVLCRELAEQTDAMTRPLGIRTRFTSGLTALPTAADRGVFEDMLLALISNSLRAILGFRQEGEICLSLEKRDRLAVLTLTDNGCGIPPDALVRLSPDPEDPPGPGEFSSGLALAKRIAGLHGGSIVSIVDSRQEDGTRLVLSFPLLERPGGALRSPVPSHETDRVPAALADCLPVRAFLPEALRL